MHNIGDDDMSVSITTQSTQKKERVSTSISSTIKNQAQEKLAKQGMSLSDFLRCALDEYVSGDITVENFLDTKEALRAKHNVESGKNLKSGTLDDFEKMLEKL